MLLSSASAGKSIAWNIGGAPAEGPPWGASMRTGSHACIEKEPMQLVFIGQHGAQRRRRRRATWRPFSSKYQVMQSRFTACVFDIRCPCYGPYCRHLSKQVIRWPVSRDHIAHSGSVHVFLKLTADQWFSAEYWFSIGSLAYNMLFGSPIKILAYPGLALSGFEQPSPGAPLLGLG